MDSNVTKCLEYLQIFLSMHRYELWDFTGCVTDPLDLGLLKERVIDRLDISTPAASLHPLHNLSDSRVRGNFGACREDIISIKPGGVHLRAESEMSVDRIFKESVLQRVYLFNSVGDAL